LTELVGNLFNGYHDTVPTEPFPCRCCGTAE
jgi:hypothetical protein